MIDFFLFQSFFFAICGWNQTTAYSSRGRVIVLGVACAGMRHTGNENGKVYEQKKGSDMYS